MRIRDLPVATMAGQWPAQIVRTGMNGDRGIESIEASLLGYGRTGDAGAAQGHAVVAGRKGRRFDVIVVPIRIGRILKTLSCGITRMNLGA